MSGATKRLYPVCGRITSPVRGRWLFPADRRGPGNSRIWRDTILEPPARFAVGWRGCPPTHDRARRDGFYPLKRGKHAIA